MSIEVKNIVKTYGDFTALNDISLNFPDGELVALLGPSGCGKTTLLRIIAGLDSPSSGQVLLEGQDASHTHVRERQVGFVFQHYALFRHMTVFDNVAFGLRVKPRKQRPSEAVIKKKVTELLDLVQLGWVHDRFPTQLSGGQRQRIALARALAVEPRVLLLDEPFGALDAKVRKELRRWLRSLHDELHITSIFVTHDQEEALEVADKIVLMNKGKVEQAGTPSEVYEKPATPFVYGFLGNVNLFHGRVDGQHIRVGQHQLSHSDPADIAQGAPVLAFVRPHELSIVPYTEHGSGVAAVIDRVLTFGVSTRIELTALPEASNEAPLQHFEVELPRQQANGYQWSAGERVRLVPSQLTVFENSGQDWVI
ncbi:MAG: sulfate ABC transporter ATP-binding protein [Oxalobacter sp.]|nr:MAG: sulfate ABC transporter ATP-binding protein [Oxalobacter sp.]